MAWPAAQLVLYPDGRVPVTRQLIPMIAGKGPWPNGDGTILGGSVVRNLHPTAVSAIADIVKRCSGHAPIRYSGSSRTEEGIGHALADWLIEFARESGSNQIATDTVAYLFSSGAHRAHAIAAALRNFDHGGFAHIVDIGSGVGVIPWLLRRDFPDIRDVHMVEPRRHLQPAIDQLWRRAPDATHSATFGIAETTDFASGKDVVMFCQCLFRVAPDRRLDVLHRAWQALNPGGVLLLNEGLRDASTPAADPQLVHRNALIDAMPGTPRVFMRRTNWRADEDLSSVSARAMGYDSVVIALKT